MDNMTMIITPTIANPIPVSWAALVPSADVLGGVAGVFTDRGRTLPAAPKTGIAVDPRPAGPPV